MIVELCGLPASGKSTCIKKFVADTEKLGIEFEVVSPRKFYPATNKNVLSIIFGVALCIKNVTLEPRMSIHIMYEIMKKHKLLTKFTYFKIFICIQYHINWVLLVKGLKANKINNRIVLLDGSPWNIITDLPEFDDRLANKILSIYPLNINRLIVFSNPDIKKCHNLMINRQSQPLEPKLYGDIEQFITIKKSLDFIFSELMKRKSRNLHFRKVNLLSESEVGELLEYVKRKYEVFYNRKIANVH